MSGRTSPRLEFYKREEFSFVPFLEGAFEALRAELAALSPSDFVPSPDSLTTVRDGYDETGWLSFPLFVDEGAGGEELAARNRARCPQTVRACGTVPGLVNASFSRFAQGTRLYPHHGERPGVLRCHLPLEVPAGELGLRLGGETRRWALGRCLVFDDTHEHEAWNLGEGDRTVLLVTFAAPRAAAAGSSEP